MTRPKTIDPDAILDAAEAVIRDLGVQRFTLDAVAERAGISKGGLVYSFSTKDALIGAMIDREYSRFHADAASSAAKFEGEPNGKLLGHLATILADDEPVAVVAGSLLTGLVHAPQMLEPARAYLKDMLSTFDLATDSGRRARLAFLAVEGMYLMRAIALAEITNEEWIDLVRDARDLCGKDDA